VQIHHYLDESVIRHEECMTQVIFHTQDRIWTIPTEWKNKRLVDGKFMCPTKTFKQVLDLREGYHGFRKFGHGEI